MVGYLKLLPCFFFFFGCIAYMVLQLCSRFPRSSNKQFARKKKHQTNPKKPPTSVFVAAGCESLHSFAPISFRSYCEVSSANHPAAAGLCVAGLSVVNGAFVQLANGSSH